MLGNNRDTKHIGMQCCYSITKHKVGELGVSIQQTWSIDIELGQRKEKAGGGRGGCRRGEGQRQNDWLG